MSVHTVRGKTTHLARVCHHSGPVAYTQPRTHSKVNLSITGSAAVGSEILIELVHTFQVRNPESVGRIRFRCLHVRNPSTGVVSGSSLR